MSAASLPAIAKLAASEFRLQHQTGRNAIPGGEHQGESVGEPLWFCEIETTALSRAQGGAYAWLLTSRRGVLRALYLYDNARPRPLAYHDEHDPLDGVTCDSTIVTCDTTWLTGDNDGSPGSIPAWGSPQIVGIDRDARTIELEGFLPGAVISDGDYGCWNDGATRRLHILGAGVAAADGSVTLTCEPPPPETSTALPAGFVMEKPCAEMLIMRSTRAFSAPVVQRVSIEAIQVLRSE